MIVHVHAVHCDNIYMYMTTCVHVIDFISALIEVVVSVHVYYNEVN